MEHASPLGRASRMQFRALAGHYESHDAKHRRCSVSVDHSPELIHAEFHFVLWNALVSSDAFSAAAGIGSRLHGLCFVAFTHVASSVDSNLALLHGPLSLLHVLPRRTRPAETGSLTSHFVLFLEFAGQR